MYIGSIDTSHWPDQVSFAVCSCPNLVVPLEKYFEGTLLSNVKQMNKVIRCKSVIRQLLHNINCAIYILCHTHFKIIQVFSITQTTFLHLFQFISHRTFMTKIIKILQLLFPFCKFYPAHELCSGGLD